MTNMTKNAVRVLKARQADFERYKRPASESERARTRPGSLNPRKGGAPKGRKNRR